MQHNFIETREATSIYKEMGVHQPKKKNALDFFFLFLLNQK